MKEGTGSMIGRRASRVILAAGALVASFAALAQPSPVRVQPAPVVVQPAPAPGRAAASPGAAMPAAAPELSPEAAKLLAQRDELSGAIVKRDTKRVAAWIQAHKELNFNFDEVWRGRTFQSPLTVAINLDAVDIARILLDAGAQAGRNDGDGRAAIHYAKSAQAVQLLVRHGADINALDRYGKTAVANAVERGNLQMMDTLLAGGARLDVPLKGTDLFTRAIELRQPELVGPLLERGVDPRLPPTRALWLLIESGDTERALLLIRRGADPNARDERETLLTRALFRQRWEVVEALIDAGASLRVPDSPECKPSSVRCQSIQVARLATFNPRVLAMMAARGLDLNTVASNGHTALSSLIVEQPMAIRALSSAGRMAGVAVNPVTGQTVVTTSPATTTVQEIPAPDNVARAKALLDLRADPNVKYQGVTPLMLAIALPKKPPELADVLLNAGGRIDFEATIVRPGPEDGPSRAGTGSIASEVSSRKVLSADIEHTGMSLGPLTWAAWRGRPDIALRLLERDRKVSRADRDLLYFAAAAGQWDLLMGALPYTREVNVSNRADVTPLMFAADAGRADAVRALLAAGANVNVRSVRSWPPLSDMNILAAIAGHSPTPPRLAGGYTALGAASKQGHTEVAQILIEAGGRE